VALRGCTLLRYVGATVPNGDAVTPSQARQASLLRQRLVLALVELAAELGSAPAAVIRDRTEDLARLRTSIDNMRAVLERDRRKVQT
jgi:hypothetical protein